MLNPSLSFYRFHTVTFCTLKFSDIAVQATVQSHYRHKHNRSVFTDLLRHIFFQVFFLFPSGVNLISVYFWGGDIAPCLVQSLLSWCLPISISRTTILFTCIFCVADRTVQQLGVVLLVATFCLKFCTSHSPSCCHNLHHT